MMDVPLSPSLKRSFGGASALLLVVLALSGCGSTGTHVPATPTAGVQSPPTALQDPAHWGPIVGLKDGDAVEQVSFGHLVGDATLQALVTVRVAGSGGFLNVYVYDRLTDAHPRALFALAGLLLGDARISAVNTLLTAQSDGASDPTDGPSLGAGLVQDLFREFRWSKSAGAFVQIAYPSLFPDLTRWQAEADQAKVSAGQDAWKLDAPKTAVQFARSLLKWPADAPATLQSGGGTQDRQAVVRVESTHPDGATITLTLRRFDEAAAGLWEVIQVQGETWLSITSPQSGATLTSPITVTGTSRAFEGNAGTVFVLNHLYAQIGQARPVVAIGHGSTPFTATVTYDSSFQGGAEEGMIALYFYSEADGSIATTTLVKVLLSA